MKKLPLCTLLFGAIFAVSGTIALVQTAPRPEPFPLFFPLLWDLIMVGIGAGVILRCDCARRAGMIWGAFCIVASLAIGAAAFGWLWPQQAEPLGTHRLIFDQEYWSRSTRRSTFPDGNRGIASTKHTCRGHL